MLEGRLIDVLYNEGGHILVADGVVNGDRDKLGAIRRLDLAVGLVFSLRAAVGNLFSSIAYLTLRAGVGSYPGLGLLGVYVLLSRHRE